MARAPTTADAFNAIAEPRRRDILELLARGEQSVNAMVDALDLAQSQTSKHLAVLSKVGLVRVRKDGRKRLYCLNAKALKPVHDWVKLFERHWNDRLDRLADYLNELQRKGTPK